MDKDKDSGATVIIPCKQDLPIRGGADYSERKAPEPVRDTLPPPVPPKPDKK